MKVGPFSLSSRGRNPVRGTPDADGPWTDIEELALACAPAAGHAELAATASRARRTWARYGELPDDPAELRACLFFEQRRWNLFGGEPEGRAREYAAALVRAIAALPARAPHEGPAPEETGAEQAPGEDAAAG